MTMKLSQIIQGILLTGLGAGTMDITAACVQGAIRSGRTPFWVFQSVAGGWFGTKTFEGGYKTAAIGLLTHFFIATTWAAVYYLASLKFPLLTRHAVLCGILYGILVYVVMYMVVLPLSAYNFKFFNQSASLLLSNILIHMF